MPGSPPMHIGVVLPPYQGHLNPGSTLAGAVKARGHRVTLISAPLGLRFAEREGLEFYGLWKDEVEEFEDLNKELAGESGIQAVHQTGFLLKRGAQLMLRDLPVAIDKLKVDALLIDEVIYWAASTVADDKKVPYGTIANALALMHVWDGPPIVTTWQFSTSWWEQLRNRVTAWALRAIIPSSLAAVNEWLKDQDRPVIPDDTLRTGGIIQLAQQPAFFEFPKSDQALPRHFFYTSPWHLLDRDSEVSFPFDKLKSTKKLIYASLGTVQNKLMTVYQNICKACVGLEDIQLVIALGKDGASLDLTAEDTPKDCLIVDFAPQLQILRKCSIVISHCGMNTCCESLACGVPALAIPLTNDQPGVAARWKSLGAAVVIDSPKEASPQRIQEGILELLAETSSYHKAAKELQQRLQIESPTLEQTAELIEIAFQGTEPLSRNDAKVCNFLGDIRVEPTMQ